MITEILDEMLNTALMYNLTVEYIELGVNQMKELTAYVSDVTSEEVIVEISKYKETRIVYTATNDNLIRIKYIQPNG